MCTYVSTKTLEALQSPHSEVPSIKRLWKAPYIEGLCEGTIDNFLSTDALQIPSIEGLHEASIVKHP